MSHSPLYRWQFQTEGNDIAFGLFRRTRDSRQKAGEMEEIIPSERVNSHMIPEEGSFDCSEPGVCRCKIKRKSSK